MRTNTRTDMLQLGRVMRSMRTAAGLTQREMGRRIGIAQSSLSSYEHGKYVPWDVRHDFAREIAREAPSRRAATS